MTRPIVLIAAALVAAAVLHPWTWASHGMRDVLVPAIVLAIVAVTVCIIAIRLGDLRLPARRVRARPARPTSASDAMRAAEALIRDAKRRR